MGLQWLRREHVVYVDASISDRHERNSPKESYVAYVVKDSNLHAVKKVDSTETYDAELQAILFALNDLRGKLHRFSILCDHESVVSEVNRKPWDSSKKNPLLMMVRSQLDGNPSIRVSLFESNPADKFLRKYLLENAASSRSEDS
jgi:ribonuclease HI